MPKLNIILTGATGFVGQRYVAYNQEKYNIKTVSLQKTVLQNVDFQEIDTVVHSAGIAHQMQKIDPKIYFDINFEQTIAFATVAKEKGVKHFIFLSTIKVFGEHHTTVLDENTPCEPINDPYGESKLKAEIGLKNLETSDFTVSIVRPPLVYGPGVKGNLIRFLHLGNTNYYLPFGGINNKRTMVFLDNLIELINTITDKKASGIFLAGDDRTISTTELISNIRTVLNKPQRLFKVPNIFIFLLKKIKPELAIRLFGSLEMNTSYTNQRLNHKVPYTVEKGLATMTNWFLENNTNAK